MMLYQPIFATRQPLRIGAVQQLLLAAGIEIEPTVVYPDELPRAVGGARNCLVILDGQSLPQLEVITWLRRHSPASRIVVWTGTLSTELLLTAIECELDGLLSSRLPLEEAAHALWRICRGERLLRFDSEIEWQKAREPNRAVAEAPSFDAQWMLHGAEPQGREK